MAVADDRGDGGAVMGSLRAMEEVTWFNPAAYTTACSVALDDVPVTLADVRAAEATLARFAPLLAQLFPDTDDGIIESPIRPASRELYQALQTRYGCTPDAGSEPDGDVDQAAAAGGTRTSPCLSATPATRLWLKMDSHLPVAGSIKARGGVFEVLRYAERLALEAGLVSDDDNYTRFADSDVRAFLAQHRVAVGSTGNLGLSIGIMSAALGFDVTVHMSADARQWKKDKLRSHGVTVVEYDDDYSKAVDEGRKQAMADPHCHFVDDESSVDLFLGYAVAGVRLQEQLRQNGVVPSAASPLFVHLPCGVGGGPGGVAFGLKLVFGDAVRCIFAEPTASPCMLLGVYTGKHDAICVGDIGLSNKTAADGLAVGRPSAFIGRAMARLIDGYYTVDDDELFRLLAILERCEGLRLEPSAAAGLPGPARVAHDETGYRSHLFPERTTHGTAHHVFWLTGGSMVPDQDLDAYMARGNALLAKEGQTRD
eukprot:m.141766 g.141766  ORF g.141766 m.141766 type:complete len:483 (+) comp17125_c2_seq1:407-1855(+)